MTENIIGFVLAIVSGISIIGAFILAVYILCDKK